MIPDWLYLTLLAIAFIVIVFISIVLRDSLREERFWKRCAKEHWSRVEQRDDLVDNMRRAGRKARAKIKTLGDKITKLQLEIEGLRNLLGDTRKGHKEVLARIRGERDIARRDRTAAMAEIEWYQRHTAGTRVRTVIITPARYTKGGKFIAHSTEVVYDGAEFDRAEAFRVKFLTDATPKQIKDGVYAVVQVALDPRWQTLQDGVDQRRGRPEPTKESYLTLPAGLLTFEQPLMASLAEMQKLAAESASAYAVPRVIVSKFGA